MSVNGHHVWFPRASYKTGLEKDFRGLCVHIVSLDRETHDLLHAHQEPPQKPSRDSMMRLVRRHVLGCPTCAKRLQGRSYLEEVQDAA